MTYAGLPLALRHWILDNRVPSPAGEAEAMGWVEAAARQGLAGLLAVALPDDGRWPAAAVQRLRHLYALGLVRAQAQYESGSALRRALAERGVRTLPLKGAALVDRLYESSAERPMVDVDLLVLERWPAALAAVNALEWRVVDEGDHAAAFEDPQTQARVELHRSVTSCPGFHPLDAEGLWARSHPSERDGERLPVAEDLLVQLSLHVAFQHGFAVSMIQLLDVRRLLERLPLDVAAAERIAAAARATHAVGATLMVAREIVGAPVNDALDQAFVAGLPGALVRWLQPRLADGSAPRDGASTLARARWELSPGRRLELVRRTLAPSSALHPDRSGLLACVSRAASLARRWARPLVATGLALGPSTRRV